MLRKSTSILSVMLLVVMAVSTACGGKEEPATETTAQPPAAQEQPAPPPVQTPQPEPPAQETPQRATGARVVQEPDTSPHGFYTIQLSSWRTRSKAESEAESYRAMGLEAYVQEALIPDQGTWYRVRVGSYQSLSDAQEAMASLNVELADRWVDNFKDPPPA
jgi:DedD protein